MNWQNAEPTAAILVLPPDAESLDEAHAAIEQWEHYSGKTLDSTQRLVVEVMMAETAAGRWAARTTGREMPRQNGKGDEIEVVEFWGLTQRAEAILHSAHELITVSSAHERMVGLLNHRDLRAKIRKTLNGLGQQMIEMTNGGVILYRTRTNGGGRGLDDISRLVIDEAQHAKPEQLASATPTLLANPNPQMNFAGTGAISGVSMWWWQLRKRALSDSPGQFGYVGHTAEVVTLDEQGHAVQGEVDPTDQALWFAANPALCAGRGEVGFFAEQLQTLGPDLFAREHLGVWDPEPGSGAGAVIPGWGALADQAAQIASHEAWAIAVSPIDQGPQWASIGKAGRTADGRLCVGWVAHEAGTAWIVPVCVDLFERKRIPLRVHKTGPEGALIKALREAGVDVVEVSTAEVAQSTGDLIGSANADPAGLVHLGQASLDKALRGAVLRMSSDGGAVWSQRSSSVEISPLMAVTVAAGGVSQAAESWLFV